MEGPRVQHTLHREHGLWFGGELCVAVEGFHRKGALPVLGGPQTDGSGTAADRQLPGQMRAVGHKQD